MTNIFDPIGIQYRKSEGDPAAVLTDGVGNLVGTPAFPLSITGALSATNPSVGLTGAAAPTSATEVGGADGGGLLRGAQVLNAAPGGAEYGLVVRIAGAAAGGTSSAFAAAFPAAGTAVGVKDSAGVNMTYLKATAANELVTQDALLLSGNAKAQVAGTGTAGTPAAGVVTVQGIVGGTVLPISDNTTSTFNNGAETAVSSVAIQILAANASRKGALFQNTGANNIRVGAAGVAATTGVRLVAGAILIFSAPFDPTSAVFAIREGGSDSIAFAMELT